MSKRMKESRAVAKRKPKVELVEVEETQIENAVTWINDKIKTNVYGTYLDIGNYILETFFNNDFDQVKSFNPHKTSSFRKLAEREDLLIKKTHLHNSVRVAIQERLLLPTVQSIGQLTFTHKTALLPLKSLDKKKELIEMAVHENWSVSKLKDNVKVVNETEHKSGAGRPVLPYFQKNVNKIDYILSQKNSLGGLNQDTLSALKEDEIRQIHERTKHILTIVGQVNAELESTLLSKKKDV
jgi:hypothetical protein